MGNWIIPVAMFLYILIACALAGFFFGRKRIDQDFAPLVVFWPIGLLIFLCFKVYDLAKGK